MNRFRKGLALEIAGVIILLAGLMLRQFLREEHRHIDTEYTVLLVLAMGLLGFGGAIYMWGRKLRVRLAEEVLKPGEPYILYLRSFASEKATARLATADPWILQLGLIGPSEEEKLAKTLRVIAPGVAVGKPGEKLPERGFYRMYIDEKDWLSEVKKRMLEARLVLVRIGDRGGLLEEMELARKILQPEHLVLIVPRESNLVRTTDEFDTGLHLLRDGPHGARSELTVCPGLTVPIIRIAPGGSGPSFVGIIYFDSSWTAHARSLSGVTVSLTKSIDRAFKPIYQQLGIRKGIRLYEVISVLVGIGLFGLIVFLIYSSWQHHHPNF